MNGTFQEVSKGMKPTEPSQYWYLALLGTDPSVQGKGYGGTMLKIWFVKARETMKTLCTLTAVTRIQDFYIKHGGF